VGRRRDGRVGATVDRIEYARLLKAQGTSLGAIAAKTGIPKTSLHRYLTPEPTDAITAP
jgi:hypothetical protein